MDFTRPNCLSLGTLESNNSQIKLLQMGRRGHFPCELGMALAVTVSSGHYHRALGRKLPEQSLRKMHNGINHGVMRSHMVLAQVADVCKKHLSAQESCQLTAAHMPPRSLCPAIGWIDQAPPHLQMVCPDAALFDLGVVGRHRPSSHRAPWIIAFFFLLLFSSLIFLLSGVNSNNCALVSSWDASSSDRLRGAIRRTERSS